MCPSGGSTMKLGLRLMTPDMRWSNSCALLRAGSSEWVPPLTGRHAPSTFGWPSTVLAGGQGLAGRLSPCPASETDSDATARVIPTMTAAWRHLVMRVMLTRKRGGAFLCSCGELCVARRTNTAATCGSRNREGIADAPPVAQAVALRISHVGVVPVKARALSVLAMTAAIVAAYLWPEVLGEREVLASILA